MKAFFSINVDEVTVRAVAQSENGDILGDMITPVKENEDFYGVKYDEMKKAGNGVITVDSDGIGKIDSEQEPEDEDPEDDLPDLSDLDDLDELFGI